MFAVINQYGICYGLCNTKEEAKELSNYKVNDQIFVVYEVNSLEQLKSIMDEATEFDSGIKDW
jgi:hypothetical protein